MVIVQFSKSDEGKKTTGQMPPLFNALRSMYWVEAMSDGQKQEI